MASKIPAAILAARAKLAEAGQEINEANLKSTLSRGDMTRVGSALRTAWKKEPEKWAEYQKENKDKAKTSWTAAFVLDPNVANLTATQNTDRVTKDGSRSRGLWLTMSQMASPTFWNSQEDAELISQDCEERPHSSPSMAAANKKEYYCLITEDMWEKYNKESINLKAVAEIGVGDYHKVKEMMANNTGERPPKKAKRAKSVGCKLEDASPDEKVRLEEATSRKKAMSAFNTSLASLKKVGDRTKQEMKIAMESSTALVTKGYPEAMVDFYKKTFVQVSELADASLESWAEFALLDMAALSPGQMMEKRASADEWVEKLNDKVKEVDAKAKEVKSMGK